MSDQRSDPGAVLERQLKLKHMVLRRVVNESKDLADHNPDTYAAIKRSLLWTVIQGGYVNAKRPTAAFWNSIIAVLWAGNWHKFDEDMNFAVPHTLRSANNTPPEPIAAVDHYLDGEQPLRQRQRLGQPTVPATDFLFTADADALLAHVVPVLQLECRRLDPDQPLEDLPTGRAIILQEANGTQTVAWHLQRSTFQRHGETYKPPQGTKAVGIAEWMQPTILPPTPEHKAKLNLTSAATNTEDSDTKTLTIPVPTTIRDQLRRFARQNHVTQRRIVEEALLDLLNAADQDPDTIPPDHHLERPRDDGSYPIISHLITVQTHDRLAELAQRIGTERERHVYMKEIALHALKRVLPD